MPDPNEIDAALATAQSAVDELSEQADELIAQAGPSTTTPVVETPVPTPGIERILRLRVPVVVRLAERDMPLSEVLNMSPGSIVEFERNVNAELDLLVNNCRIGSGAAIKVGERFGIRVSFVGDVRQRIQSLAVS